VHYLLAQEIDREPFTLFRLRGIDPAVLSCGASKQGSAIMPSPAVFKPAGIHLVPNALERAELKSLRSEER
jgi:hypothetical protein